jgi:nucleotide-binding universal stress UspA family protein
LGKASLTAMGITNFIKIIENSSQVDGIISELDSGNYDLLVIGAPAPTSAQSFFWPNLTSQIINQSTKPVLVVPMLHD